MHALTKLRPWVRTMSVAVRHQSNDASLLRESVRKVDYDHYASGLLLPQHARDAFFAIRAVNAEIASVKDSIRSNHMAGKIRIQWWRDQIHQLYETNNNIHNGVRQETLLLRSLGNAIDRYQLTRRWFERVLDARDRDLEVDEWNTLEELEVYAERTASTMLYLTLECLDVRDDMTDRAAGHAGMAIGLVTLLRGTPFHIRARQLYLPQELLEKHKITRDDLAKAVEDPAKGSKIAPVVFDVACQAKAHLDEARSLRANVLQQALPAFYTTIPTSLFLNELERVNFNVFDESLQQRSPLRLHYELVKNHFLKRF